MRVVTILRQLRLGSFCDHHGHLLVLHLFLHLVQHQVNDLEDVLLFQGMEHYRGIYPVQELWPEELFHLFHDLFLHLIVVLLKGLAVIQLGGEPQVSIPPDQV